MIQRALTAAVTCTVALLCADTSVAQIRGVPPAYQPPPPPPRPPQAIPVVPPPVDHPAYAAQPLMPRNQADNDDEPAKPSPRPAGTAAKGRRGGPPPGGGVAGARIRAKEFLEKRVAGDELEAAVEKVTDLPWHDTLLGARARSASTGRPILWINSLGELDGFA